MELAKNSGESAEWNLGLKYLNNSFILLNHIFDFLTEFGCVWKPLPKTPYGFRCKTMASIKFEFTLFKTNKGSSWTYYLVDLFLVKGEVMDFLAFVSRFYSELKKKAYIIINCYY